MGQRHSISAPIGLGKGIGKWWICSWDSPGLDITRCVVGQVRSYSIGCIRFDILASGTGEDEEMTGLYTGSRETGSGSEGSLVSLQAKRH